ncbi:MAG: transposase [Candidatus Bipolaricaulaceae bacterium]
MKRVQIFVIDDLPNLEEAIRKIFPDADWQLCILPAVWDALNKARKKAVYRTETEEEARKG